MEQKVKGFTFVELVVVIVVLGLLAAVALPRFIDVTEEAEQSAVEAMAGGFASGAMLIKSQWLVDGQPEQVVVDGRVIEVNDFGLPSGGRNGGATNMNNAGCNRVFDDVFVSPPSHLFGNADVRDTTYFVRRQEIDDGGGNVVRRQCNYFLVSSLDVREDNGRVRQRGNLTDTTTGSIGFSYNAATGEVVTFNNAL